MRSKSTYLKKKKQRGRRSTHTLRDYLTNNIITQIRNFLKTGISRTHANVTRKMPVSKEFNEHTNILYK